MGCWKTFFAILHIIKRMSWKVLLIGYVMIAELIVSLTILSQKDSGWRRANRYVAGLDQGIV